VDSLASAAWRVAARRAAFPAAVAPAPTVVPTRGRMPVSMAASFGTSVRQPRGCEGSCSSRGATSAS
jgi:hypothetical protein